jgi:hypothetical protein
VSIISKIGLSLCIVGGVALASFIGLNANLILDGLRTYTEDARVEPIEQVKEALHMDKSRDESFYDELSLDYLHEFTDDHSEIWSIVESTANWCGTPMIEYLSSGRAKPSKKDLRLRAALLLLQHRLINPPSNSNGDASARKGVDVDYITLCRRGFCRQIPKS